MKSIFLVIWFSCIFNFVQGQGTSVIDTVFRFNNDSLRCKWTPESDERIIFEKAEQSPFYPGGAKTWNTFLSQNLRKVGIVDSVENTVWVQFVVRKNGELSDFKILRSNYKEQADEALRAVKESQHWLPATQNGFCVNAYIKIPIKFE